MIWEGEVANDLIEMETCQLKSAQLEHGLQDMFVCYTYRPDSVSSDKQVDLVDKAILEGYFDLFGLQLPDIYQLLPDPDAVLVYLF